MKPVRLHLTANSELSRISKHYDEQQPGLGLDFAEDVERTFSYLRTDPDAFPKVFNEIRRTTLRRFPYNLFFVIRENDIQVLAIAHFRRRPGYWLGRRRK